MENPPAEPSPEGGAPRPAGSAPAAAPGRAATGETPPEKKEKDPLANSGRGIQTLFRSSYRVHVNLTTLADSKANFLISVNSLIMFLVAVHGTRYVEHTAFVYPVVIVLLSCTGSIIFAVLSARPRITREQLTQTGEFSSGLNLLFFGHFTRLPRDIYKKELSASLKNKPGSYELMMDDLYEMGQVLNKKFRQLQFSYMFLLYGLPSGMILFTILEILHLSGKLQPSPIP